MSTEQWRDQLTHAFEVLLGRPLGDFDQDADYAAYFGGNLIDELDFMRDAAWTSPAALRGDEPVVWESPVFDLDEPVPTFDASRSVFEFGKDGLPPEFEADLASAAFAGRLVLGADLADLLDAHDLAGADLEGTWTVCRPRLVSDGTLYDAMRAATSLGAGPESLLPFEAEPAAEWQEALAGLEPPGLAAHLGFFCTDGDEGLAYLGADPRVQDRFTPEGGTVIAHWEEGQDQVELTVVRLPGRASGPRPTP
ncbi:hypothetical protein DZF91_14020 [Actinomadura logoneensis]|uniref:Uncharacterized protein n=1 Tax=Actinomadura logoneensis TaxID=2293572 RepID=A0A372JLY3_9ACTN|nr:hypothetical protein [Actinomadura logoneensis]RFU41027.1 hypothetical protein DZF91_14020 [Actinomadura logoneensis]